MQLLLSQIHKRSFIRRIITLICIFLLLLPYFGNAQNTIIGNVIDATSGEPVPFATIYINGTTKGTITNILGDFKLEKVNTPSELVVSHISYHSQVTQLEHEFSALKIALKPNILNLQPINVIDKNLREKNIKRFREQFLGADFWGKTAEILNDSVLRFHTEYSYKKYSRKNYKSAAFTKCNNFIWSKDSTYFFIEREAAFRTIAHGPIIIDKPALGYKMYVDLFKFSVEQIKTQERTSSLGYYYFQPYDSISKRDQKVISRNRKRAYFNSSQHFCRSLFDSTLSENGYQIYDVKKDTTKNIFYLVPTSIDRFIVRHHDYLEIIGLKDKTYTIAYFYKGGYRPQNLKGKLIDGKYHESQVTFERDTCRLYSSGNIPNNNIVFSGAIATKLIGAFLPEDYDPNE